MCHDAKAAPPIYAPPTTTVDAAPLSLTSVDGATFAAFLARPAQPSGAGVLVLPDNAGLSGFYEQLAVHLAEEGHTALAIDYFGRTAGTGYRERDEGFGQMEQLMKHLAMLTPDGLYGDIVAAADHLRAPDGGNCRAVVALGFCFGGRYAFFAAAPRFGLAGVIGFYGVPGSAGPYGPGPTQHAAGLRAPILALFGGADHGIPPSEVAAFGDALTKAGVEHQIVIYPGAPHSFFDRKQNEYAEACGDAWRRVRAFLQERSTSPDASLA